jgi:hypothetical protein
MSVSRPIRVLVIDDSASVRQILKELLEADGDIVVIGTASDPFVAAELPKLALADDANMGPRDAAAQTLALEVEDEGESVWSAAATVDVSTRCVLRGVPCSTGGVVLPTLEFGAYGVTASVMAFLGFDEDAPQVLEELDFSLTWSHDIDDLSFAVGTSGLTFPVSTMLTPTWSSWPLLPTRSVRSVSPRNTSSRCSQRRAHTTARWPPKPSSN